MTLDGRFSGKGEADKLVWGRLRILANQPGPDLIGGLLRYH